MKRHSLHLVFAAAATLCTAGALWQGLAWQRALTINERIATAGQRVKDGLPPEGSEPPVVLARALALAQRGEHDAALKAYNSLIPRGPLDETGRAALFDLGNLYLRQGLAPGQAGTAASLPMIELAKQRYRDLLRHDPDDWDARYNLERALRLAPEEQEAYADAQNEAVERRNVMLRGMTSGDLP